MGRMGNDNIILYALATLIKNIKGIWEQNMIFKKPTQILTL